MIQEGFYEQDLQNRTCQDLTKKLRSQIVLTKLRKSEGKNIFESMLTKAVLPS